MNFFGKVINFFRLGNKSVKSLISNDCLMQYDNERALQKYKENQSATVLMYSLLLTIYLPAMRELDDNLPRNIITVLITANILGFLIITIFVVIRVNNADKKEILVYFNKPMYNFVVQFIVVGLEILADVLISVFQSDDWIPLLIAVGLCVLLILTVGLRLGYDHGKFLEDTGSK
eukprot:c8507_g1_i1.p1 GENE.c8507_g1_i1~~c8507_g1_i1.p1  ORF type:complete len:175 (+),score=4.98 c8507_g1_i1:42-566(+)